MFGTNNSGPRFGQVTANEMGGSPRDADAPGSGRRIALVVAVLVLAMLAIVWFFAGDPCANPLPVEATPVASRVP